MKNVFSHHMKTYKMICSRNTTDYTNFEIKCSRNTIVISEFTEYTFIMVVSHNPLISKSSQNSTFYYCSRLIYEASSYSSYRWRWFFFGRLFVFFMWQWPPTQLRDIGERTSNEPNPDLRDSIKKRQGDKKKRERYC